MFETLGARNSREDVKDPELPLVLAGEPIPSQFLFLFLIFVEICIHFLFSNIVPIDFLIDSFAIFSSVSSFMPSSSFGFSTSLSPSSTLGRSWKSHLSFFNHLIVDRPFLEKSYNRITSSKLGSIGACPKVGNQSCRLFPPHFTSGAVARLVSAPAKRTLVPVATIAK